MNRISLTDNFRYMVNGMEVSESVYEWSILQNYRIHRRRLATAQKAAKRKAYHEAQSKRLAVKPKPAYFYRLRDSDLHNKAVVY